MNRKKKRKMLLSEEQMIRNEAVLCGEGKGHFLESMDMT